MAAVVDKLDEVKKVLEEIRNQQKRYRNQRGGDSGGGQSDRKPGRAFDSRRGSKGKRPAKAPSTSPKMGGGKTPKAGGGAAFSGFSGLKGLGSIGRVAGIAGAAVAVVGALVAATAAVVRFGDNLVKANRHLAMYSATIARANFLAEMRQIQRDQASAAATGPQLAELNEALQDLYDEMRPIKDLMTNASAKVATYVVRFAEWMVQLVNASGLTKDMKWLLEQILGEFKEDKELAPKNKFFEQIMRGDIDKVQAPKLAGV